MREAFVQSAAAGIDTVLRGTFASLLRPAPASGALVLYDSRCRTDRDARVASFAAFLPGHLLQTAGMDVGSGSRRSRAGMAI